MKEIALKNEELNNIVSALEPDVRKVAHNLYIAGGTEEDLVQEGLIGLCDSINSFDTSKGDYNSESFKSFALLCARRQMLDAIRKAGSKKHQPLSSAVPLDNSVAGKKTTKSLEEELVDTQDENEKISTISFTKTEKRIIEMLLLGLTADEIASSMGKSKKAIDDAYYRLRKKIKGE